MKDVVFTLLLFTHAPVTVWFEWLRFSLGTGNESLRHGIQTTLVISIPDISIYSLYACRGPPTYVTGRNFLSI